MYCIHDPKQTPEVKTSAWSTIALVIGLMAPSPLSSNKDNQSDETDREQEIPQNQEKKTLIDPKEPI